MEISYTGFKLTNFRRGQILILFFKIYNDVSPVSLLMGPDIDGDDRFFGNNQFDGHSVGKIYGNGMKRLQFSFQGMKPEGWMMGVQSQEFEGLFILAD